jgi:hypothetical protein
MDLYLFDLRCYLLLKSALDEGIDFVSDGYQSLTHHLGIDGVNRIDIHGRLPLHWRSRHR